MLVERFKVIPTERSRAVWLGVGVGSECYVIAEIFIGDDAGGSRANRRRLLDLHLRRSSPTTNYWNCCIATSGMIAKLKSAAYLCQA